MSHTPTPWMTIEKWAPDECMIGTATGTTNYIATLGHRNDGDMHDNASHIVHCVNVHDQLVAALRLVDEKLGHKFNSQLSDIVDEALAAAEKGA